MRDKQNTLRFALLSLLFFLTISRSRCNAQQNNPLCRTSSCGNIQEIRFPFRLKTDPGSCGQPNFEITCQNHRPLFRLNSKTYYVQSITYSNFSIRLLDPGLEHPNNSCSPFPNYFIRYDDVSSARFAGFLDNIAVTYMTCQRPAISTRYVNTTFCGTNRNANNSFSNSSASHPYQYMMIGDIPLIPDLESSCGVEAVARVSPGAGIFADNTSLVSIHEALAYGFELSWFRALCGKCEASHGFCSLEGNSITCDHYCPEDVPLSKLGFRCQFKFWGPIVLIIGAMAIGALMALRFVIGFPFLVGLVVYKWRRRHQSVYETIEDFLRGQNNLMPIRYTYGDVRKMTGHFQDRLGEGGYGTVFKGKLRSGTYAAVKMMSQSMATGEEFISEVDTIGRIHHVNVVQLVGFCVEGSKRALVYEFMPNGSLDKYIYPEGKGFISLSYKQMFEISLGVARGIDYLHRGCDMQILHFDIKPHNILLDEHFSPKISDFGLAKLYPTNNSVISLTAARGTMGYMAPEMFYKNIGGVSYKADVYSFGMLLMEMAGRLKTLNPFSDHVSQVFFPTWVYDQLHERNDIEMGNATEEERIMVKKMIIVALWCIQMKPAERPSMSRVVEMLEGDAELLHMPPRPFMAPREIVEDHGIRAAPMN